MNTSNQLALSSLGHHTINIPSPGNEFKIQDLLDVFSRRRAVILGTVAVFLTVGALVCVFTTRRYSATAEIQVQKESGAHLGLDASTSGADASYSDAVQDSITIQTQVSILQSDSLALKVIHDLNLASSGDFKPQFSPVAWLLNFITPAGPTDAQLGPPDDKDLGLSPRLRMSLLSTFGKYLTVKALPETRLIDISFVSSNPRVAADVVNHLAQGLMDYNFETRHSATGRTAAYLADQLADLKKQSEVLQEKLAVAQRKSGVLNLGGVDSQGREQVYSAVLDKLQQATTAYTQSQANRIAKEAVYQAALTGDPEAISSVTGGASLGTSGADSSLALIQGLRLQQATLQGQLAESSAKFGAAYPKLAEMRQNLEAINNSIASAISKMAKRAKNDAIVAQGVERKTRAMYLALEAQANALNEKTTTYTILRQEAEQSRSIYETVLKQLKEERVMSDFNVSNVSIVDPARVPARPSKPNVLLLLSASLASGLFIGACGALLRDSIDNKIDELPQLGEFPGTVPLGVLPFNKQQRRLSLSRQLASSTKSLSVSGSAPLSLKTSVDSLAALTEPRGPYTEALRSIRTLLMFSRPGAPPKVILVTSSVAGEGKSTLSANLAVLLAQQGGRVLLVDGDLRGPALHHHLKVSRSVGLSSILTSKNLEEDSLSHIGLVDSVPGLHVVSGGPLPLYPADLIASPQMAQLMNLWRREFDFIIVDSAPLLPVTDSILLSELADLTVVVARYRFTERPWLERACSMLQSRGDKKIAVVLNALDSSAPRYYSYYGTKNDSYYGKAHKA